MATAQAAIPHSSRLLKLLHELGCVNHLRYPTMGVPRGVLLSNKSRHYLEVTAALPGSLPGLP